MTRCTPVITHNKHITTPPTWAGFSFALHLLRVQGFYFALLQYGPIQAFTACFLSSMQFLYHPRHKTAHRALQVLFLQFVPLSRRRYQTDASGYNIVCDTLERITAPQHLQRIPDTRRNAGRYTGQHSRPIIIRYIRAYPCYGSMPDSAAYYRPYKPGGGQRLHLYRVSPAASQYLPRPAACDLAPGKPGALHPAGQSSSRGSSAAARNH